MIKKIFRFLGFIALLAICSFCWYIAVTANYTLQEKQDMGFGLLVFALFTIVVILSACWSLVDLFKKN